MAIVTYATYAPDVAIYAPGCPTTVIIDALRKSAMSFFYDSLAYRTWVTPFDLTSGTTTYDLAAKCPAETEVAQVMEVRCEGFPVTEVTHEQFIALDPEWPTVTGTHARWFTILNTKDNINIIPIPDATITAAMTMQLAVTPTMASTGVEQTFFEEWKDGIIDGALARLLRMPQTPWVDVKEAATRSKEASMAVNVARMQVNKGNTRADVTVQMRRWV